MNVLVTGGAGFIGQHVTRKVMERGHRAVVYDLFEKQAHKGIEQSGEYPGDVVLIGDVRDRDNLKRVIQEHSIDRILHLASQVGAGQSMYLIEKYTDHNVTGTAALLDALADGNHNVSQIVLASSRAVYGEGPYVCPTCGQTRFPWPRTPEQLQDKVWEIPCGKCGRELRQLDMKESNWTIYPTSIYGENKLAQENLIKVAANAYGLNWVILRLFNTYGAGQSVNNPFTGIVSILMNWAMSNDPMMVYEDGQMVKDFVYVGDVAESFMLAMNSPASGTFNIGTGERHTMLQAARLIRRIAGSTSEIIVSEQYRVGDARHGSASTDKAKTWLGFEAKTTLVDGLKNLYDWAKSQPVRQILEDGELVDRGLSR